MTEASISNPDSGASLDQVTAVSQLLAQEFNPVSQVPEKKDEQEPEGQPDLSTLLEGEGEGSTEAQATEPSEEEATWGSALGIDENHVHLDDNGNLAGLTVKVDGEESVVPVKELIAGYQSQRAFTKKSQILADERREFEQVRDSAASNFLQKLEQADRLAHVMQARLMDKFKNVDLEGLRHTNPAEYVARKDEIEAEAHQIRTILDALNNERTQLMQHQQQEQVRNLQNYLQEQREIVFRNNPDWTDQQKLVEGLSSLYSFANSEYGITDQEFSMVSDARHLKILQDAMAFRKGQALATEKVTNAPKFMKTGKTGKPMDKLTQLTLNARKAQGANRLKAQTAAVNELLANL